MILIQDHPIIHGIRIPGLGPGQLQTFRDSGLGQGLKYEKSGIRDWEQDPDLWDAEFRD